MMSTSPEVLLMDAMSALDMTGAANGAESKHSNADHGYTAAITVLLLCFLSE
jgi:hypothetical protein